MKTYNFKDVSVIVGGRIITGFADGDDVISVSHASDAWSSQVGAGGEVTRSKSNNEMGTFTLKLQQTSESNDVLMGFYLADKISNSGVVPVLIKDNNGSSLDTAEQAWIKKLPDSNKGANAGSRDWVLETDNLVSFVGGN